MVSPVDRSGTRSSRADTSSCWWGCSPSTLVWYTTTVSPSPSTSSALAGVWKPCSQRGCGSKCFSQGLFIYFIFPFLISLFFFLAQTWWGQRWRWKPVCSSSLIICCVCCWQWCWSQREQSSHSWSQRDGSFQRAVSFRNRPGELNYVSTSFVMNCMAGL